MTAPRPLRAAVVGLGDIAGRVHLPLLAATPGLDLVPVSRDEPRRLALAARHGLAPGMSTLDALEGPLDAAFVHAATVAHEPLVAALLDRGVPVFVDKPLAEDLAACGRLVDRARRAGVPLVVGFNRRFAPRVRAMAGADGRTLVRVDKHRRDAVGPVRRVVFDDFIHVVDTLLALAPGPVRAAGHHGVVDPNGGLRQVSAWFEGEGFRLEGAMQRDAAVDEEWLEVRAPGHGWRIEDLSTLVHLHAGEAVRHAFGDWEPRPWRRGFPQMLGHFLDVVREGAAPVPSLDEVLATHAACEAIARSLEGVAAAR